MTMPESYLRLTDSSWLRVRDAVLKMISEGADPDESTVRRVGDRLAALDPEDVDALSGHCFEMGHDLGRHVYAKRVPEDSFENALGVVEEGLSASGWAAVETEELFHREAILSYGPGAVEIDPPLVEALVAGVVHGTVSVALNTPVALAPGEGRLGVELVSASPTEHEEVQA